VKVIASKNSQVYYSEFIITIVKGFVVNTSERLLAYKKTNGQHSKLNFCLFCPFKKYFNLILSIATSSAEWKSTLCIGLIRAYRGQH
jgi:hypothetical protein